MLEIKTAEELIDPELEARWATRRAARQTDVLQRILRLFVEQGGSIPVAVVGAAFPDLSRDAVWDTLVTLDEEDLIQVREGRVDIAYPFSAAPTAFVVRLANGRERYACCAIDALGIAPMLGQRVHIRSQCHHCQEALEFDADPDGPSTGAAGVMAWIGERTEDQRRVATSL